MQLGKGWLEAASRFDGRVLHVGGLFKLARLTKSEDIELKMWSISEDRVCPAL